MRWLYCHFWKLSKGRLYSPLVYDIYLFDLKKITSEWEANPIPQHKNKIPFLSTLLSNA